MDFTAGYSRIPPAAWLPIILNSACGIESEGCQEIARVAALVPIPAFLVFEGEATDSLAALLGPGAGPLAQLVEDTLMSNLPIGDRSATIRSELKTKYNRCGARKMSANVELSRNEVDLLAWNVTNEVVNGFAVHDFNATVGTSREAFRQLASRLRSAERGRATITLTEAAVFRNALALTLRELGEDEFHTRTGHSFEEGNAVLARLNRSLENR